MKALWHFIAMVLFLSILAVFSSMSSPTGAFAANLPPSWDFVSSDFRCADSKFVLDLQKTFFDPDGDSLAFSVSPDVGLTAGVYNDVLTVYCETDGFVTVSVSDGKNIVSKRIFVYN